MNEITKNCCACKIDKPVSKFYKNKALKMGYDTKCKSCKMNGKLCRKPNNTQKQDPLRKKQFPYITNTSREDWTDTYLFLRDIGYELREDLSIHEQFCLKYGFTPKKKVYETKKRFTPKELGLI